MSEIKNIRNCQFCGKKPVFGLTKKTGCQLHGDPVQYVTLGCKFSDCPAKPSVLGGDIYQNGEGKYFEETKVKARNLAIDKWGRTPTPQPASRTEAECVFTPLESLLRLADVSQNYTGKDADFKNVERTLTAPNPQPASAALEAVEVMADRLSNLDGMYAWDEERNTIRQALAQCVWQPIETAPKDGETVFLIYKHCNPNIGWQGCEGYYNPTNNAWSLESGYTEHPTHWMPLPAAPVVKGE